MQKTLVILGSGYTARFLWSLIADRSPTVFATSRTPEQNLGYLPANRRLRFDLSRPDTWINIPRDADLLWCFPATPIELVRQFIATLTDSPRRIVVLGSTSAYDLGDSQEYPPPWIDETAPIDLTKPRVQGEEYLRREQGAIVLRVAGIYGSGRNPLDWIRTGRVKPSRKYVNLIHVEDLAAICLAAVERGRPGETYNVSDGTPRTWQEICHVAQERWEVTPLVPDQEAGSGKRISIEKLTGNLGYPIRYPHLFEALEQIEPPHRTDSNSRSPSPR